MAKLDNLLVYHWHGWKGFLISHLVADYCKVEAQIGDDLTALSPYLTPNIKAVLLQINLSDATQFSTQYQQLFAALKTRNITPLNAEIQDISKSNLHQLLEKVGMSSARAPETGAADEVLFVKSNLNWGGVPESRLPEALKHRHLPVKQRHITGWDTYYKAYRSQLSQALWQDPSVVIERYIDNADDSFYRVYGFGEALVFVKAHSAALVKKISGDPRDRNFHVSRDSMLQLSHHSELPDTLLKLIAEFIRHYPLFYFCLDIVHNQHEHIIVDLNLTPYSGVESQTAEAVSFLQQGGQRYLQDLHTRQGI